MSFDLDQMISDLTGAGIKELQVPIPVSPNLQITLSNIRTEDEISAILASEEFKGHHWIQRIKCEILSRSVSKLNDNPIKGDEIVADPRDPEQFITLRVALRDRMMTWAPEFLQVVWKIYMVHCQNVEDNLLAAFPEQAIMTDYEQRFYERTMKIMDEISEEMALDTLEPKELE